MRIFHLCILALALAAPLHAGDKADSAESMICKYRQETGTRFKTKTCRTAAQWEEIAEQNRAGLKDLVDRPQIEIRNN